MTTIVTAKELPFQNPPHDFSRRQVLFLDGIRYSAEMAQIAYQRLYALLQGVSPISGENLFITKRGGHCYMHGQLIDSGPSLSRSPLAFPGLKKGTSVKLTKKRTEDIAD